VTEQLLGAGVLVAVFLSVVAVLLSIGTAMRISQIAANRPVRFGLRVGEHVPDAELRVELGAKAEALITGPTLIMFVKSDCPPCRQIVERVDRVLSERPTRSRLLAIEPAPESVPSMRDLAHFNADWIRDPEGRLQRAFKAMGTPALFLINEGVVVLNEEHSTVEELLDWAPDETDHAAAPPRPVAARR